MYQRAQLKESVKTAMRGTRPRPIWVTLLYLVIAAAGAWLLQLIVGTVANTSFLTQQFSQLLLAGYSAEEAFRELVWLYGDRLAILVGTMMSGSLLMSILTALWQGLMGVGYNGYCLSMVRGENPQVGRLFCGFPMFGKVLLTRLLVWVFTTLWTMLYCVCLAVVMVIAALLMDSVPVIAVILMVAGYIAFLLMVIRVCLRYALVNYVLLDSGEYGLEAINLSKTMMKGNKGRLFMLGLSFIGWYLIELAIVVVGAVIIGIITVAAMGAGMIGMSGAVSIGALAGITGGVILVAVLMGVATLLLSIWLQPYITGSVAKFYDFLNGDRSIPQQSIPPLAGDSTTSSNPEY